MASNSVMNLHHSTTVPELKFVQFFETKNAMVEPTCKQLYRWKQAGHAVQVICLDNAGKN